MFKSYESKPITRTAHKITAEDQIEPSNIVPGVYYLRIAHWPSTEPRTEVMFKAYEECKVGDYIVYLKEDDIYHCSAEVFAERNIVPEDEDSKGADTSLSVGYAMTPTEEPATDTE